MLELMRSKGGGLRGGVGDDEGVKDGVGGAEGWW